MIDDRFAIGEGWVRPTLVEGGTPEQQARWLPGIDDRSTLWCQLFSEPDAGSDLASLRTVAERDGDVYVVNGSKVWSTWANHAAWGILLARTDANVAEHKGISYFALDMATPGIEVRPLVEMTGGVDDPVLRQQAARVYTEMLVLRLLGSRRDGPASSIRKALADEHGQHVTALMLATRGADGMLGEASATLRDDDVWAWGHLFSRALTIGGGTSEVQRNVIGERLLGLPRETRTAT